MCYDDDETEAEGETPEPRTGASWGAIRGRGHEVEACGRWHVGEDVPAGEEADDHDEDRSL